MRFDEYFESFDSLWDSEKRNFSLDEKREAIRNERAARKFEDLLRESAEQTLAPGQTEAINQSATLLLFLTGAARFHAKTIGQNWVRGALCPGGEGIVVPLAAVKGLQTGKRCECVTGTIDSHPLVPFGALLRRYERGGTSLNLQFAGDMFSGRVISVFRDAVTFATSDSELLITFDSIESISIPRS